MEPGQLFTRRQAMAAGHDDRDLTDMVRAGSITRVARGVYRVGFAALPDSAGTAKALRAAISHQSAAAWYGAALLEPPDRLHVTVPRSRGRRVNEVPGVVIHRRNAAAGDLLTVRRTLVTSPVRTALDLARTQPTASAVATIDSLCRQTGLTTTTLLQAAQALPSGPGRRAATWTAHLTDARAESVFESISRVTMAVAGLPPPTPQLNIFAADGSWIARVDFAWEELRVVLECDGFEYHGDRAGFERDRRRWTALTRAGWRVAVITWRDIADSPDYLLEVMADYLCAAG